MSQRGLLKHARLTRKQLIAFALTSAVLNGVITASVGAPFTNELYKLTKLSFIPFASRGVEGRDTSERRIKASCVRPELKPAPATPAATPPTDAVPEVAPATPPNPSTSQ